MKVILRLLVLLFLVCLCLSSCAAEKTIYAPAEYGPGSVVAIWDLEDLSVTSNPALTEIQAYFTAKIIETFAETGGYSVIERQNLLLVLEELNLGSSALSSDSSRLAVGQIIGAQLMVFGAYQLLGEQLRIDLRLVEVESGVIIKTAAETSTAADIAGWIQAVENAAKALL